MDPSAGGFLKTHDFLQPLERIIGTERLIGTDHDMSKEENKAEPPMETARPEAGVLLTADTSPAQASSSKRYDDNSNFSSYTGSGFTLCDESLEMNKGQTGKENNFAAKERREVGVHIGGQWATSLEPPSQSLSSHSFIDKEFSSLSSSQLSFSKKQSFMDMINSANSGQEVEDEDTDEFVIKKELSPHHKGNNISIQVEEKGTDPSPNTPRSKHCATEQRRRSKINERFQMLRGLIPNSDQRTDKASFLLEVAEYIHFLQEKVKKYEDPYQGWSQEPPKIMPWENGHKTAKTFGDQFGGTNCDSGSPLVYATKFNEANTNISSTMPRGGQEYEICTADTIRKMAHHRGLTNNGLTLHAPPQQTMYSHKGNSSEAVQLPPRVASNTPMRTSQSHRRLWQSKPSTTDSTIVREKMKDQEMAIKGGPSGTISISSVYSQELLNTLTQSLQSSGVDLSQASISVQIDIANAANRTLNPSTPIVQTDDPCTNQTMPQSRLPSSGGESEQAFKRLKTGRI